MRQVDIKKDGYYSNGEEVRVVTVVEADTKPWLCYRKSADSFEREYDCLVKTFAKWAERMVAPLWVTAVRCPDCEGWCDETDYTIAGDVMISCSLCGYVSEESIP